MSTKPNILLEVASLSMGLAKKYVNPYSHPKSPHKFTQAQLLTLLVLRAYTKTTYRGITELLDVSDALRARMGLSRVPHYSTLKKFADRSSVLEIIDRMLADVVREFAGDAVEVSMDSTGMETTAASSHYQSRSGHKRKKYVKLSLCVMAGAMIPAGNVKTSNVAFGGPNRDQLFTTGSAAGDSPPGTLYRLDLGVKGLDILPARQPN